jgi:hypothetical protein
MPRPNGFFPTRQVPPHKSAFFEAKRKSFETKPGAVFIF